MIINDEQYWDRLRSEIKAILSDHLGQPKEIEDEIGIVEASKVLDLTTSTLYKMVGTKKIPFKKQGTKKLIFSRQELQEWKIENRK